MKQIVLTFFGLSIGFLGLSAQESQEVIPPMAGWNYYGGDEFNGTSIDKSLWGIYGDSKNSYRFDDYGNNKKQGMAQTYRDNMITVKNGIVSIRATREPIYTGIKYKKNTDCSPKMRLAPLVLRLSTIGAVGQHHSC